MKDKHKKQENIRKYSHEKAKRTVSKMLKLAEELAEDSVALEFEPVTIEWCHWLLDQMRLVQEDVTSMVDQGQLRLPF